MKKLTVKNQFFLFVYSYDDPHNVSVAKELVIELGESDRGYTQEVTKSKFVIIIEWWKPT